MRKPSRLLRKYIFVYGTLKRGFHNHDFLTDCDAKFVSECATVLPYPLIVARSGLPFLLPKPGHGQRVEGELFLVPNWAIHRCLDRLEGHPTWYYRDRLRLQKSPGAEEVLAQAYFLNPKNIPIGWEKSFHHAKFKF